MATLVKVVGFTNRGASKRHSMKRINICKYIALYRSIFLIFPFFSFFFFFISFSCSVSLSLYLSLYLSTSLLRFCNMPVQRQLTGRPPAQACHFTKLLSIFRFLEHIQHCCFLYIVLSKQSYK